MDPWTLRDRFGDLTAATVQRFTNQGIQHNLHPVPLIPMLLLAITTHHCYVKALLNQRTGQGPELDLSPSKWMAR